VIGEDPVRAMASLPLEENTSGMNLRILTEADYLRAHITVIVANRHRRKPSFHNFKHLVNRILKKYTAAPVQNRG
jgi:hypothetical protein